MNNKLKSYVNGLFADCPKTKKAQELKEEILSNLSEHFNEAIKNGYSENDAYTEAISKLGNIDELLQSIMPDKDLAEKINAFKAKKAKITAIAVMLYIIGTAIFIGIPGVAALTHSSNIALCGIIGLITLLIFVAIATGLLIFVNMSAPQEIMPYIAEKEDNWIDKTTKNGALIGMIPDGLLLLTSSVMAVSVVRLSKYMDNYLSIPLSETGRLYYESSKEFFF